MSLTHEIQGSEALIIGARAEFEADRWRPAPLEAWRTDRSGRSNYEVVMEYVSDLCARKQAELSARSGKKSDEITDYVLRQALHEMSRSFDAHHRDLPSDVQAQFEAALAEYPDMRQPDERINFLEQHPAIGGVELCQETHAGLAEDRLAMVRALKVVLDGASIDQVPVMPKPRFSVTSFDGVNGLICIVSKKKLATVSQGRIELVHRSVDLIDLDEVPNSAGGPISLTEDTRRLWNDIARNRDGADKVSLVDNSPRVLPRLLAKGLLDNPFSKGIYPVVDTVYAHIVKS